MGLKGWPPAGDTEKHLPILEMARRVTGWFFQRVLWTIVQEDITKFKMARRVGELV